MKRTFTIPLLAMLLAAPSAVMADELAQGSVKLFSFTVDRSEVDGTKSIGLSATDGQSVQVDWGDGTYSAPVKLGNYDDTWETTPVKGEVAGTTVTVYGTNPATINVLDLSYGVDEARINGVDVFALTSVTYISIDSNDLTKFDASTCTALQKLELRKNKLSSLILPETETLITVDVSNDFDTNSGKLKDNGGNNQVLATDWSKAPKLATLKINGNSDLGWFDSFDIEKNKELTTLEINGCELSDNFATQLSALTKLKTLNAQWNYFTKLDLSKMVALKATINAAHNSLTEIKLPDTSTSKMTRVNVTYNNFTFATLPMPGMTSIANNYMYTDQAVIGTPLNGDNKVDFSTLATINGKESVFTWKLKGTDGDTDVPAADYTVDNGVFTFNKDLKDLFCTITNETFPKLTLTSAPVTSANLIPELGTFEFTTAEGDGQSKNVTFEIGSRAEGGQLIYIDWGDGNKVQASLPYTEPGYSGAEVTGEVKGTTVTIYTDPSTIETIECAGSYDWFTGAPKNTMLTKADVSKMTALTELNLRENQIAAIDLSKNTKLTKVNMNSNKLTKFDAALPALTELNLGNNGSNADKKYGENAFESIDFTKYPALKNLTISYTGLVPDFTKIPGIETVYAIGNGITSVDLSNNSKIDYLSLNYNKLTEVDATKAAENTRLLFIGNELTNVKLPAKFSAANISNNNFTFASLAAAGIDGTNTSITYAPQKPMAVTADNGKVDLSSQAEISGKKTVYAWTANDEAFDGYTAQDGVFTFTANALKAVCSMTNEAYPKLTLTTAPLDIMTSGIDAISGENGAAVEFFNLQGVKVSGNEPGIYVRRQGNKTTKVIVK